jgi:hypothetical protein
LLFRGLSVTVYCSSSACTWGLPIGADGVSFIQKS